MTNPSNEVAPVAPEVVQEAPESLQGIVAYTDGGVRPNPGFGGWGMHGYLYKREAPKKGSGNPDYILTAKGYKHKSLVSKQIGVEGAGKRAASPEEVTPIHYVDGFGSFANNVTNNIAELVAATQALQYALEFVVQEVQVYTDSEYVRNGIEKWVDAWQKNGWVRADLSPVANVEYWKDLIAAREQLLVRGVLVKINWVRSHSDRSTSGDPEIIGNVIADRLATLGVMSSRNRSSISSVSKTVAEGYWKYDNERHPFIFNRRMYFNTLKEHITPGVYYLGEHGKEDDLLGKRQADGSFSIVRIAEPDYVLEMLRTRQMELANGADTIIMARLDAIYQNEIHQQLVKYGHTPLTQPNRHRLDLCYMDDEKVPLTRELRPPNLAMRAVEAISALEMQLDAFIAESASITITDLTDILYETTTETDKKGNIKTQMKLKAMYNVGFASLNVDALYHVSGEEKAKAPVTLTLGIDMLDRNAFKRLEELSPSVKLITWLEAPGVFRYATVIKAGSDIGIWGAVYSNLRIVV